MASRKEIITEARKWINTPFRHQGRVLGVGIDCVGLVIGVGLELALLNGFKEIGYGRQPNPKRMRSELDKYLDRVSPKDAKDGDILYMSFEGARDVPMHTAIKTTLEDGREGIIHAFQDAGKCVEHGLDDVWKKRIMAAYKYKGVK